MSGSTNPDPTTGNRGDGIKDTPNICESSGSATPLPRPPAGQLGAAPPPCLQSESLLQGRNSVEIAHHGAIYRLQATRQGKLILTK